jgi:hypothetical protein
VPFKIRQLLQGTNVSIERRGSVGCCYADQRGDRQHGGEVNRFAGDVSRYCISPRLQRLGLLAVELLLD